MSVTDLTGTSWTLNNSLTSYPGGTYSPTTYHVNITTAEALADAGGGYSDTFNSITIGYNSGTETNTVLFLQLNYNYPAYIANGNDTKTLPDTWNDYYAGEFTITGGTDVTNADLISWFEANASAVTPATPDVVISYNNTAIATMSESATKTLETEGTFCTDDITVVYTKPSAPTPTLQAKTNIAPSTSSQTITADAGYDGLSSVQINAMPSGSATTPATSITAPPTLSVANATGIVTATISKTQSVTPSVSAGYVASGTAGNITVSGSNTLQLTTQAATTITPTTSVQTAVPSGRFTTGAVKVAAIPTGTAGTPTATKGTVSNHAVSVTPSVTNTTGYITGGTKTGTAVSVSASELVSGTKSITENGTGIDVTNYASVDVNVSGGGGGGGTEYTIPQSYHPMLGGAGFDLTSVNLTANDLVLDGNTLFWIEFTQSTSFTCWLDSDDDDDFTVTIPAGAKLTCADVTLGNYSNDLYFVGHTSSTYGFLLLNAEKSDDFCSFQAWGDNPSNGGFVRSIAYKAQNGSPNVANSSVQGLVLHIIKFS